MGHEDDGAEASVGHLGRGGGDEVGDPELDAIARRVSPSGQVDRQRRPVQVRNQALPAPGAVLAAVDKDESLPQPAPAKRFSAAPKSGARYIARPSVRSRAKAAETASILASMSRRFVADTAPAGREASRCPTVTASSSTRPGAVTEVTSPPA